MWIAIVVNAKYRMGFLMDIALSIIFYKQYQKEGSGE